MGIGSALEDTKPRTNEAVLLPERWRRNSLKPGAAASALQEPHETTTAHPDSVNKTSHAHTLFTTLHTQTAGTYKWLGKILVLYEEPASF